MRAVACRVRGGRVGERSARDIVPRAVMAPGQGARLKRLARKREIARMKREQAYAGDQRALENAIAPADEGNGSE